MKFGRFSLAAVAAIALAGAPMIAAAAVDTEKIEAVAADTFESIESAAVAAEPAMSAPAEVIIFNRHNPAADRPVFLADLSSEVPAVAAATFAALPTKPSDFGLVANCYRYNDTT